MDQFIADAISAGWAWSVFGPLSSAGPLAWASKTPKTQRSSALNGRLSTSRMPCSPASPAAAGQLGVAAALDDPRTDHDTAAAPPAAFDDSPLAPMTPETADKAG
jgi:hypothetical protein